MHKSGSRSVGVVSCERWSLRWERYSMSRFSQTLQLIVVQAKRKSITGIKKETPFKTFHRQSLHSFPNHRPRRFALNQLHGDPQSPPTGKRTLLSIQNSRTNAPRRSCQQAWLRVSTFQLNLYNTDRQTGPKKSQPPAQTDTQECLSECHPVEMECSGPSSTRQSGGAVPID